MCSWELITDRNSRDLPPLMQPSDRLTDKRSSVGFGEAAYIASTRSRIVTIGVRICRGILIVDSLDLALWILPRRRRL